MPCNLRVSTLAQAGHSKLVSESARAVEEATLDFGAAFRSTLSGNRNTLIAYAQARNRLRADVAGLGRLVAGDARASASATDLAATVDSYIHIYDGVVAKIREGFRHPPIAQVLTSPEYVKVTRDIRATVLAFEANANNDESRSLAALDRLWAASGIGLLVAIVILALASGLAAYRTQRVARAIMDIARKGERYRNGEPLGPPLVRGDEVGLLDSGLYEFVATVELRDQQLRRYRLLAETTRDIIMFLDRSELTIVDANAASLEAYGYERGDLIGKPFAIIRPSDEPVNATLLALTDTPGGAFYETVHRRSDGTLFPVEVHAGTADVEGRRTIIYSARDISERRRAAEQISDALDQAVEASRLKGEFVATVSHEIRTPMQGVIGMSELLLTTQLQPVQREYAATVKESAQSLLAIINDILDFSKLEANKVELEAIAFDPAQLIAGVINLTRGTVRGRGLTLHSHTSADVPSAVRGDPTRLRQVLINLVGNAAKFSPGGEVTVSASVDRDEGLSTTLKFAVRDNGIGVAPEHRARLFEAFTQGDGTTTRRFGGTGLGLSISRRLVELMGGRIWLEEREGPGATFCFTALFERASPEGVRIEVGGDAHSEPEDDPVTPVEVKGPARILVAEDNQLIRRVARLQLTELKYAVDIVENGALAVAAVARGGYELVLMDMQMPEMDGLEATRAIRAAEGESGRHVAIVALTANALESDRNACLDAGMDDFLVKPIQLDPLRAIIDRWLPLSAGEDEPPILDRGRLELLTHGDAALANDFVRDLVEGADEMLEQLKGQIASGNRVAVLALAHSLKGMATELGALRLRAAAAGLESEPDPAAWSSHIDQANGAVAELRAEAGFGATTLHADLILPKPQAAK